MNKKIRKAVIPAAGFGTRFLPASKVVPKELFPIVDVPAVQYILEDLQEAGIEEFIFVISDGKESIVHHFNEAPALEDFLKERKKTDLLRILENLQPAGKISAVYQNSPLGLGHAVLCAEKLVGNEPFIVALPDDLIDAAPSSAKQLVKLYEQYEKCLVCVQEVEPEEVDKYGIIVPAFKENEARFYFDNEKTLIPLQDLVEKPQPKDAPSRLAVIGRYVLTPEIFPILQRTQQGAIGEIQLTDGLRELNRTKGLLAYKFKGKRFDAGDRLGYLQANIHFGLKHPTLSTALKAYIKNLKI